MITLYANAISTFSAKVRIVLRHKSVAYTEQLPPDGYGSDAYRAIVPMGTIPGLLDDGLVLSESAAISEYLEERFPQPPMLPAAPRDRALVRALASIHDAWVEPQLRALYPLLAPDARDPARAWTLTAAFHHRLRQFADYRERAGQGSADIELSLADCAWPTTLLQARMLLPAFGAELAVPAALASWHERLTQHPAVAPELAACAEAMQRWMDDKLAA